MNGPLSQGLCELPGLQSLLSRTLPSAAGAHSRQRAIPPTQTYQGICLRFDHWYLATTRSLRGKSEGDISPYTHSPSRHVIPTDLRKLAADGECGPRGNGPGER